MAVSAKDALQLYRRILRLHRDKLPPALRALGDKYVQSEFRLHMSAQARFQQIAMREWQSYADNLASKETIGEELSAAHEQQLTPEQREQLNKLKEAALEAAGDLTSKKLS